MGCVGFMQGETEYLGTFMPQIKFCFGTGLQVGLIIAAFASLLAPGHSFAGGRYAELKACELSAAGGRLSVQARCGSFEVPEDPVRPEGRQIELAYAVLPARGSRTRPDPVFFLAGGPGQSAREAAPLMRAALRHVNRNRDLIFLDQRGTGGSNSLDCDFDYMSDMLEMDFPAINQRLRECKQGWDADVRHYTTEIAALDLEAMRERYGFEQINLVGGSYGTRMAQVYLRRFPERVRGLVIDGVVPTRLRLGAEHGIKLDQTLIRLFDACAEDRECAAAFPDLESAFEVLVSHYSTNGQALSVTHPRTGQAVDITFNRDFLASGLRFLAYAPQTQMMIPYLIHEAATTGDPSRLASQSLMVTEQMGDMIAIGLNFAVGCAEDWPSWPRDLDQSHTLLGNSMLEFYDTVCDWWPRGEVPEDFHQPFDPGTPMLILSGEFDPVTPPEYGDEAAAQFANSRHLVASGQGHIVSTQACMSRIVTEFIDNLDLDALDTDCMDSLGPEPFFINLLGPSP